MHNVLGNTVRALCLVALIACSQSPTRVARDVDEDYPKSAIQNDEARYGRNYNTSPGPMGAGLGTGTGETPVDTVDEARPQPAE